MITAVDAHACGEPGRVITGGVLNPPGASMFEKMKYFERHADHIRLRMLREQLQPATVDVADALGWSTDAIEAQAFGFLAARGLKGLPLSYPATTGVPIPMTGGIVARP